MTAHIWLIVPALQALGVYALWAWLTRRAPGRHDPLILETAVASTSIASIVAGQMAGGPM